ncbi:Lrp/AsnC family transcriptional regulator [Paenibacillus campi]|uniref:Lrp/AsnC family transcriptional regulator n=1 Tax=Paenibacillus campi TaxID=3106031 RepID=UPI002B000596|nr:MULTISPECIES: Lrp/AsnC family transcriptional regulator [unclassified Paenibacillus]
MDRIDQHIIAHLTENGRMTMKELGERIHLTGQATATRVLRLEEQGIIEGYTIKTNPARLGYPVHVFLTIVTQHVHHQPYLAFVDTQPEYVCANYKVSGKGCYLLECRFPSNLELDKFLVELNRYVNYQLSIVISK